MNGERAESPIINSVGQRPTNGTPLIRQALKGRNQMKNKTDFALSGLDGEGDVFNTGRCPVLMIGGLSALPVETPVNLKVIPDLIRDRVVSLQTFWVRNFAKTTGFWVQKFA
jgi:hypothetical protein